jgi:hypothetical protein
VLHLYGLHLVPTYKYEIGNYLFYSISYFLDNHLSSFELMQINMARLNQCLLLNTRKTQQYYIRESNPSVLFDFLVIFWIAKYLQMLIYIWNKISKCIMSQCGMDFQSLTYSVQFSRF